MYGASLGSVGGSGITASDDAHVAASRQRRIVAHCYVGPGCTTLSTVLCSRTFDSSVQYEINIMSWSDV